MTYYVGQKVKLTGSEWKYTQRWGLGADKVVTIASIKNKDHLYFAETNATEEAKNKYHWIVDISRWEVEPVEEQVEGMRYLIAVEGHRDYGTYFIDIDEEMTKAHPDLVFKMGEILGLYAKYGGIVKDGTE